MKIRSFLVALTLAGCSGAPSNPEVAAWEAQAANVTVTRDDWGIAHVKGRTDADAVFGMIFSQAEDDFNRVETNYLASLGRLAEAEGEEAIWRDLRQQLFIDSTHMKQLYAESPEWLVKLMDAWAAGLNYYLHLHPEVKPRVLTKFEPWMALSFSEGSIGGDIERVNLRALQALHDSTPPKEVAVADPGVEPEPRGSNGIAIGGPMTANGKAMLLINPHTSFFFRSELQMTSDEGLNAYGAVTWGQFFIYQGFNEKAGWMHTSSNVDNVDEYLETVVETDSGVFYRHGGALKPVTVRTISIPYKTETGLARREFTTWRTLHGPVVRRMDGKAVAMRIMEEPLKALQQSWKRTKATNLAQFRETMALHTNSSNNTLYADADGSYAYFHANFVPRRDTMYNYAVPLDGSNPATDWQDVHGLDESPNVINPPNGWVYNTNNFPYTAAGPHSPKRSAFAKYFDEGTENPRGLHAIRVLDGKKNFTLDSLLAAAYDSYLPAFETSVPALVKAYEVLPASSPLKAKLADPIAQLRTWDFRWAVGSVPTSLAVFWGEEMFRRQRADEHPEAESMNGYEYMERGAAMQRLEGLAAAVDKLAADFGTWETPWGEINRFQRISSAIVHPFDDAKPSIPVMFTSARWGSLASYGARPYPTTKKWYGTSGNSFVAVVEFGEKVRARAVTAGGQSGHLDAKHFNDQAERYATGNLRDVYFYPEQLNGHTEKTYRPGR
jgi:acyl-homoserine-lactone acylase